MIGETPAVEMKTRKPVAVVVALLLGTLIVASMPCIIRGGRASFYRQPMGNLRALLRGPLAAPPGAVVLEQECNDDRLGSYQDADGMTRFGLVSGSCVLLDTQTYPDVDKYAEFYASLIEARGFKLRGTGGWNAFSSGPKYRSPDYLWAREYDFGPSASLLVFVEKTDEMHPALLGDLRPPAGRYYVRVSLRFSARGFTDQGPTSP
jgi:hypothetical protein